MPEKKALSGFVGFANLPNQVHRRSIKKGFQFTLMVVGESGLGKSTFINTLFGVNVFPSKRDNQPPSELAPSTVKIQAHSVEIEEKGVKLKLNVIDTPGFGDHINNENSWQPIIDCIDSNYDAYLDQERRVNRQHMVDNRIHACLYFIPPTGHGLRPIDVEFMKQLHEKVNLIPIIAKADTLTQEECEAFKKRILEEIALHNINIYKINVDQDDDPDTIKEAQELQKKMPFAVVGSETEFEVDGRKVRGRRYPWGFIEVENEQHNDFVRLRQMLIRSHMEDLVALTNEVLYENYRTKKLMASGGDAGDAANGNPFAKFEEEKKQHEARLKKMEADMKNVFLQKVKERENQLKQSEEKLLKEHAEMKESLEKQKRELEERRRLLEDQLKPVEKKAKKKSGIFGSA